MHFKAETLDLFVLASIGLAVRSIISLGGYSGASKSPMYGDYEAQRHWQEITYNLPAAQWYTNSTANDLQYWGLDYPPLTAYHSYLLGALANSLNESYIKLYESRGIESMEHKTYMRFTVLMADALAYIPACIFLAVTMSRQLNAKHSMTSVLLFITYPGLILIDNGHFQYNQISLGLFLLAVGCILKDSENLGAFFFTLALNYKQMELYHALPFFFYLLRLSISRNSIPQKLFKLTQIASIVIGSFAVLWLPWLVNVETCMQTLKRLFPIYRGVFEDKVANIWCALNVLIKFKERFEDSQMALLCLATTLLAVLPICIHAFIDYKKKTFLFALFNTALSFFLFSFQVHEKSILLAALPALALLEYMPFNVVFFLKVSAFSKLPLLQKDNLILQYFALIIAFHLLIKYFVKIPYAKDMRMHCKLSSAMDFIDLSIWLCSAIVLWAPAPTHLPHLWPLFNSVISCFCFMMSLFVGLLYQFRFDGIVDKMFNLKCKNV